MIGRLLVALSVVLAAPAFAKTLYVDGASGSDATTYAANDSGHPWQTIERAAWGSTTYASPNTAQAAQAGDTVLITAGTYSVNGNTTANRWTVALNPANSGTSGNLITFRGVGAVEIRFNNTIRGPMIGCDTRNYIVWDHFTINDYYGGSVSDTGPVVLHDATGCQVINSDIQGHSGSYLWGYATYTNNYNAVRLETCTSCRIANNTIHRVWGTGTALSGAGANDVAIMTYNAASCIIEHNTIYSAGVGIDLKGVTDLGGGAAESNQHDNIIRYNYVHDNIDGIRIQLAQDTLVHNNLVTNSDNWAMMFGYDGSSIATAATRARIINNTLYGQTNGWLGAVYPEGIKMREAWFKNNIVSNFTRAFYNLAEANPSAQTGSPQLMEIDRNLYYSITTRHADYNDAGTAITFATWQGTYGLDANSLNGSDPLFVSAGTNFKLQGGSPALTLGRAVSNICGTTGDTIPAGAYCTGNEVMGVEATGTPAQITGSTRFSGTVRIQ